MPYDEALAARIRDLLADQPGVTERRMFGGCGFMVDGSMAVAAESDGALMVRIDPADADALLEFPGVTRMVMRERELAGWLLVDSAVLIGDDALAEWVEHGASYARSLDS